MPIFSRRQTAGVENFYKNFLFYVEKTMFQGISNIAMDVFLLLNLVWFCNVMQVKVFNSTFLVHQVAVCAKVCHNLIIITDLPQDRFFAVLLW